MFRHLAKYYIEICCITGAVLSYYGFGMFTFYMVLVALGVLFYKIKYKNVRLSYSNPFLCFICCFFFLRCSHLSFSDIPLGTLLMVLFLGFFQGQVNKSYFLKVYSCFAKINTYYLFVQVLAKLLINVALPGILYFLPIMGGAGEEVDVGQLAEAMLDRERFSGFFIEPSHLSAFLLPLTAINLFYKRKYTDVWLYIIAILLSKSGVGIVGLLVIAIFFLLNRMKNTSAKSVFPSILLIITIFIVSVVGIKAGLADDILERQQELSLDDEYSSGFVRVLRGYYVYDMMSTKDKIFGASNSTVKSLIAQSSVADSFARQGETMIYLNFFQRILIYGGAITALLFVIYYFSFLRISDFTGKCCITIFFVLTFMSGMNFSAQMLLMLTSSYQFIINSNRKKTFTI